MSQYGASDGAGDGTLETDGAGLVVGADEGGDELSGKQICCPASGATPDATPAATPDAALPSAPTPTQAATPAQTLPLSPEADVPAASGEAGTFTVAATLGKALVRTPNAVLQLHDIFGLEDWDDSPECVACLTESRSTLRPAVECRQPQSRPPSARGAIPLAHGRPPSSLEPRVGRLGPAAQPRGLSEAPPKRCRSRCLTPLRPKDTILLPCRHLCVCHQCFDHLTLDKCPVCRAPFQSYLRFNVDDVAVGDDAAACPACDAPAEAAGEP